MREKLVGRSPGFTNHRRRKKTGVSTGGTEAIKLIIENSARLGHGFKDLITICSRYLCRALSGSGSWSRRLTDAWL